MKIRWLVIVRQEFADYHDNDHIYFSRKESAVEFWRLNSRRTAYLGKVKIK